MLPIRTATTVVAALHRADVSKGGLWNATASVWQRYDLPWDGVGGSRGNSRLLGTIAVMYDSPTRHEVTIYRVTITTFGLDSGWTVGSICDDALKPGGLTLSQCPVVDLSVAPKTDPFKR